MIANMFTRAYFLDPSRTPGEFAAFSGVYPNANFAMSKNLLTVPSTTTRDEIVAHDAAVLETVKAWLKDPAFEPVKPYLSTMHDRLAIFVRQAAK